MKILGHIWTISGQFEIGSEVDNISRFKIPVSHEWIDIVESTTLIILFLALQTHLGCWTPPWNERTLANLRKTCPSRWTCPATRTSRLLPALSLNFAILCLDKSVSTQLLQSFPIRCCWTASSYSYQRTTMWNTTLGRGSWTGTRSSSKTTQQRTARNTGSISRYISNTNTHKNMIQSWRL